jgi:hypothetical protein
MGNSDEPRREPEGCRDAPPEDNRREAQRIVLLQTHSKSTYLKHPRVTPQECQDEDAARVRIWKTYSGPMVRYAPLQRDPDYFDLKYAAE